jgi:protocatechuate 3,4-dioxygenase beta subunit
VAVGSTTLSVVVTAEDGSTTRTYTVVATRASAGTCTITPTETQGPYPLLAILSNSAIVRSDIRESKTGVPLTLTLTLQDLSNGCAPIAGAAVYIWHCDKDGLYSGYSNSQNAGQAGLTYLRGIQVSDSNGQVTFTTIYPGWYAGRITHIHFQIYLNDNLSVTATATSQLAFPQAVTTRSTAARCTPRGRTPR